MKKHKQTKIWWLVIAAIVVLAGIFLFPYGKGKNKDVIENIDQMNNSNYKISVHPGSEAAIIAKEKFPNAEMVNQSTVADAYLSVEQGKTDGFVYEKLYMQYAAASEALEDLSIMPETVGETQIAVGISPDREDIVDGINAFIEQIQSDGTIDDMYQRWVIEADTTMPEIKQPDNPEITLKIGTSGLIEPMNYYEKDKNLTGFDIEFIKRMGAYLNADVQIEAMSFDALVASLESGKLDAVVSDLNVTDERKQVILMSEPYMTSEIAMLVKSNRLAQQEQGYTSLDQLAGKKIAIVTGASYDRVVQQKIKDSQLIYFNGCADCIEAVKNGKADAYITDEPIAKRQIKASGGMTYIPEVMRQDQFGFVLKQGNTALHEEMNDALTQLKNEGVLDELEDEWVNGVGTQEVNVTEGADTSKGTLRVITCNDQEPFAFISNNQIVGYDIELITRMAEKMGYSVEITTAGFESLLPSVTEGKVDVAVGGITITEERAKTVLFTDPVYSCGPVAVVADKQAAESGFIQGIAASFKRTFITENRWKIVVNGLLVTIWLSIASSIFGTLFGFLFSFPLRSKNKAVRSISTVFSTVVDGMPLVVILMVLYYIIFKSVPISAVWVGIIGFSLDFANCVAGLLNTGVSGVDKGQIEAAQSMGYNNRQVFTKIVFPQAAHQMFSQYEGAIVGLIKGTAIIGYITVEDLTKASDIIRSRTYEAFFPLIATAVLYFLIAHIFIFGLKFVAKQLDPKRRPRSVRGVK